MLFPESYEIIRGERWSLVHAAPKCEKMVFENLKRREVPAFLPTVAKRSSYGGKIRTKEIPLFAGYLFCDLVNSSRLTVLSLNHVVQVIRAEDPRLLARELANLNDALLRDSTSWREMNFLTKGTKVEVIGGPLKGLKGEFIKIESQTHFLVRVSILGRLIETEIDEAFITPER